MTRRPYEPTARDRARDADVARFGMRSAAKPETGFYAYRFVKTAPEVAARITYAPTLDPDTGEALDRSFHWAVEINGQADINADIVPSDTVWSVYMFGRRIEEAEYRYLLADRNWAREHAPHLPEANPRAKIDPMKVALPF